MLCDVVRVLNFLDLDKPTPCESMSNLSLVYWKYRFCYQATLNIVEMNAVPAEF